MSNKIQNVIYILTNPQYPGYIKIGYASDLKARVASLNTGALVEFSPYAVYETDLQNADREVHAIIALLNPILRASKFSSKGQGKLKEFFKLEPEEAYDLLCRIAKISGQTKECYRVTSDFKKVEDDIVEDDATKFVSNVVSKSEQDLRLNIGPDIVLDYTRRPLTIHFVRDTSSNRYMSFTSWKSLLVEVCNRAIDIYGRNAFETIVLNEENKVFHTKKRDTFGRTEESMRGFSFEKFYDGMYLLTNHSAMRICGLICELVRAFSLCEVELIYG